MTSFNATRAAAPRRIPSTAVLSELFGVVGASPAIRDALHLAARAAAVSNLTVLIVGETGTGKELIARGVHALGARPDSPFVAVNCASIPETLLESELFGHEAGAFTDARGAKPGLLECAGDGTLFLDEIGDLPPALQPKLLRAIEERRARRLGGTVEREFHGRIVAGTNADLRRTVVEGRFRADLFYRLDVLRVDLPALRDRGEDVLLLAQRFIADAAWARGVDAPTLTPAAADRLRDHRWPGNVRELRNVMERAVLMADDGIVDVGHLRIDRVEVAASAAPAPWVSGAGNAIATIPIPPQGRSMADIEAEAIAITMRLTAGNLTAAARILGVSRPTLIRRMRDRGMSRRTILMSS